MLLIPVLFMSGSSRQVWPLKRSNVPLPAVKTGHQESQTGFAEKGAKT